MKRWPSAMTKWVRIRVNSTTTATTQRYNGITRSTRDLSSSPQSGVRR